jgi:hypothetical protein
MKRFLSLLAPVMLVCASSAPAAIIYSGLKNIPIPTSLGGVYLNLDTGAVSASSISGWDVNPFYGGAGVAYEATFLPILIGSAQDSPILRLHAGDVIGATLGSGLNYATTFGVSGDPVSHLGLNANQFQNGQEGYIGFKYRTDANAGPYYAWMRVSLTDSSSIGQIVDWAYEDSGSEIIAGAPEPRRFFLLLLGLGAVVTRRRRQ